MYSLGLIIGELLIPAILFGIAVLLAKRSKVVAWVFFGVSIALEALSLIGQWSKLSSQMVYLGGAAEKAMGSQFAVKVGLYVILTVVAFVWIRARSAKR